MINDYTCPRCHNVFPSDNKFLHEMRCTEENPVPLNASRMVIPKESDIKQDEQNNNQVNNENIQEKSDVIPQIPQFVNNSNNLNNNEMNEVYNFDEIPKQFLCEICNKMIDEKDKADHLLCHNLEKEQENQINNNGNNNNNDVIETFGLSEREIEEQKKLERQFERNKNKRINQQNRNIRENNNNNNHNNRINNLRNVINSYSRLERNNNNNYNNYIPSNINNRRPNTNNINYNNHRNYQNNRNNQISNGPVVTIQTGQNGNRIITHVYPNYNEVVDIQRQQNMNFIPSLIRRHNNNLDNAFIDFGSRRHGNNIFNRFQNIIEEIANNGHYQRPTDKQLLNEFPETKIDDINKLDPEKRNCVICLEDFKSGEKATLLPCVHLFHKNCIKNWLKSKNSCPICKFELTRENINKQVNKFK